MTNKKVEEIDDSIETETVISDFNKESNFVVEREENKEEENEMNIEFLEKLAVKYINANDTENIFKILNILIKKGSTRIATRYAISLYQHKYYTQSFNYFSILSECNHPIAKYFIGIMKFKGEGCTKDRTESYNILKYLSLNGINKATDFLNRNFPES